MVNSMPKCLILLLLFSLFADSSHAQNILGPPTTFAKLHSKADFIGWIKITSQCYEQIPYKHEGREARYDIATIYTFKILDEVKKLPDRQNEFVSIGGEYEHGLRMHQSSELYFETGEEIFVHLARNTLLFDRLQLLGVNPGGRGASTFVLDDSEDGIRLVPYALRNSKPTHSSQIMRDSIGSDVAVVSPERPGIDYLQIKKLYNQIDSRKKDAAK